MKSSEQDSYLNREFPMSDKDFSNIQALAYDFTGIRLSEHKKDMVYGRLSRRIRLLRISNFSDYCTLLSQDEHPEHNEFINAITTNLTSFFREPHHFDYLKTTAIPSLLKVNSRSKRLRVWSAGCSTGEEPYSISIVLKECVPTNWDTKLLATDLDSNVIDHGRAAVYNKDRIDTIDECRRKRWYYHDKGDSFVKVKDSVRDLITFKRLNLLEPWPMKGPFDIIFCRNVVIYFDKDTQKRLFDRYADLLAPNGYLFIGHSESLHNVSDRFVSLGKTMYKKVK